MESWGRKTAKTSLWDQQQTPSSRATIASAVQGCCSPSSRATSLQQCSREGTATGTGEVSRQQAGSRRAAHLQPPCALGKSLLFSSFPLHKVVIKLHSRLSSWTPKILRYNSKDSVCKSANKTAFVGEEKPQVGLQRSRFWCLPAAISSPWKKAVLKHKLLL